MDVGGSHLQDDVCSGHPCLLRSLSLLSIFDVSFLRANPCMSLSLVYAGLYLRRFSAYGGGWEMEGRESLVCIWVWVFLIGWIESACLFVMSISVVSTSAIYVCLCMFMALASPYLSRFCGLLSVSASLRLLSTVIVYVEHCLMIVILTGHLLQVYDALCPSPHAYASLSLWIMPEIFIYFCSKALQGSLLSAFMSASVFYVSLSVLCMLLQVSNVHEGLDLLLVALVRKSSSSS